MFLRQFVRPCPQFVVVLFGVFGRTGSEAVVHQITHFTSVIQWDDFFTVHRVVVQGNSGSYFYRITYRHYLVHIFLFLSFYRRLCGRHLLIASQCNFDGCCALQQLFFIFPADIRSVYLDNPVASFQYGSSRRARNYIGHQRIVGCINVWIAYKRIIESITG